MSSSLKEINISQEETGPSVENENNKMSLPPLPPNLKPVQHYLKTAAEHDKRDPVVAYYCRLYAMQRGMEIDKKSPDCRTFLVSLMDYLEKIKTSSSEDAILNEVVGQAHLENYALKVFLFADNEDRAGRFNKNVVKSFYTAGMLFDVLGTFGEISEDIEKNKKYAKWKAAYIHKCLKSGETPIPGPVQEEGDEDFGGQMGQPGPSYTQPTQPPNPAAYGGQDPSSNQNLPTPNSQYPSPGAYAPPTTPQDPPPQAPKQSPQPSYVPTQDVWTPPANPSGVKLTAKDYQSAMKLCKYASSALQYEDSKTAIDNLSKALKILTTGQS